MPLGSNRRTALAMLGLAPAVMVTPDTVFAGKYDEPEIQLALCDSERISGALRKLADAIDTGEVSTTSINMNTVAEASKIITHTLSIEFAYKI